MASPKVLPLRQHLQERSGDFSQDGDFSRNTTRDLPSYDLRGLALLAVTYEAFPGAKNLVPVVSSVSTIQKKLKLEQSGNADEIDIAQNLMLTLNLLEDGIASYRHSLAHVGFQTPGENKPLISLPELRAIHGSLEQLSWGLKHYLEDSSIEAALRGIAHFQGTFSALLKDRLAGVMVFEAVKDYPLQ